MEADVLLPLKYNVPFVSDIKDRYALYKQTYGSWTQESDAELEQVFEHLEKENLEEQEWSGFCHHYLDFLVEQGSPDVIRNGWRLFTNAAEDPATVYRDLIVRENNVRHFPQIPAEFVSVVEEVVRDGQISVAERNFLIEKCDEYEVSLSDCDQIVQAKLANKSGLLLLIDHITRDGVVTRIEEALLAEKAKVYGVTNHDKLNRIVERFKAIHTNAKGLKEDDTFRNLVAGFFIAQYIVSDHTTATSVLVSIGRHLDSKLSASERKAKIRPTTQSLINSINRTASFEIIEPNKDLHDVIQLISNIQAEWIPESDPDANISNIGASERSVFERQIDVDGTHFTFKKQRATYQPLFHHTVGGDHVTIFINVGHSFLHNAAETELELVSKLALSTTMTRLQMYDDDHVLDLYNQQISINAQRIDLI